MADRIDFPVPRHIVRDRARACTGCGKKLVMWPHPTSGKHHPFDVESAVEDPTNPTVLRLESHFARCVRADEFRRERRSSDA